MPAPGRLSPARWWNKSSPPPEEYGVSREVGVIFLMLLPPPRRFAPPLRGGELQITPSLRATPSLGKKGTVQERAKPDKMRKRFV